MFLQSHKPTNILSLIFFIAFHHSCALEQIQEKPPLSPEQLRIDIEKAQIFNEKLQGPITGNIINDSVNNTLKITDIITGSCLDANCIITKSEFNSFLSTCIIPSNDNTDSIRTNVLFNLLKKKYTKFQADLFSRQYPTPGFDNADCDTGMVFYRIRLLSSTDSLALLKSLNSNLKEIARLSIPTNVAFYHLDNNDANIARMLFNLKDEFLDFEIEKHLLDSIAFNSWSTPIKLPFGFCSFNVMRQDQCRSGFNDFQKKIQHSRFVKNLSLLDTMDIVKDNLICSKDTLVVQFWAMSAEFSDKGTLATIDTTKLSSVKIIDSQLPFKIRRKIREQYYLKGYTYFKNYRNDYCIWNLKILSHIKSSDTLNNKYAEDLSRAKIVLNILNSDIEKSTDNNESEKRNHYLAHLYEQNRIKYDNNNPQVSYDIMQKTERQLNISVIEWIKSNVNFSKPIFFEKYLPRTVTDY